MTTRIALLFAAALLITAGGVAAQAATPVDPDTAPIASVDRFSDKAAHLQLRTPENHLPGANQPVDFDTGPFITQGFVAQDRHAGALLQFRRPDHDAGARLRALSRGRGQAGRRPARHHRHAAGREGYNDFRQVWKVTVPKDYAANTVVDAGALKDAGYKMEQTPVLRNMPVVPDKSTAKMRLKGESAALQCAWYRGPGGEIL